jgi:hypothetical protein
MKSLCATSSTSWRIGARKDLLNLRLISSLRTTMLPKMLAIRVELALVVTVWWEQVISLLQRIKTRPHTILACWTRQWARKQAVIRKRICSLKSPNQASCKCPKHAPASNSRTTRSPLRAWRTSKCSNLRIRWLGARSLTSRRLGTCSKFWAKNNTNHNRRLSGNCFSTKNRAMWRLLIPRAPTVMLINDSIATSESRLMRSLWSVASQMSEYEWCERRFGVFGRALGQGLLSMGAWSSGYDSCFGCRRSRVQIPALPSSFFALILHTNQ